MSDNFAELITEEAESEYCYSRHRGRACLLCEHTACGNCPECSPEVPD